MRLDKLGDIRVRFFIDKVARREDFSKSKRDNENFLRAELAKIGRVFMDTFFFHSTDFPSYWLNSDEQRAIIVEEFVEFNVFIDEELAEEKLQKLFALLADVCRDMGWRWIYMECDNRSFLFFPENDMMEEPRQLQVGTLIKKDTADCQKGGRR